MPVSNTPDFMFENSNRSFPFEDSNELQKKLSFDSVLDLKGFSRSPVTGKIKLIGISRWNTGSPKPVTPGTISDLVEINKIQLYFEIPSFPSNIYMQVGVPVNQSQWPCIYSSSIQSESEVDYIKLSVVFGSQIVLNFATNGYTSFSNTYLEQSCVMECYKRSLDQLSILRSTNEKEYIFGDVVFANGVNSSVYQSGNTIGVRSRVGDGLGRDTYTGSEISPKCDGILSINGIRPNEDGQFVIKGGLGVSVVDVPESNKIIITIQSDSRLLECSEAP